MKYGELDFKKINLDKHSEVAIKFRAESYSASFGTDKGFWEKDGLGGKKYIDWLKNQDSKKFGAFHVWLKDEIIGQMELGLFKDDKSWGYVNLYYLKNEFHGKGYSKYLDDFAVNFLKSLGVKKAKLSVSPSNIRALRFYEKNGWKDKGPRTFEGRKGHTFFLHLMEKIF